MIVPTLIPLIEKYAARGDIMKGWSLGERAGEYTEDMLFAEIHRRIPIGEKFLISQRIRTTHSGPSLFTA